MRKLPPVVSAASALLLAACAGVIEGEPARVGGPPVHFMADSFREIGTISMELKHGSPSEAHWAAADADAVRKCRDWGYVEAEVTGTRHYEALGQSDRRYKCRGDGAVEAWNQRLKHGDVLGAAGLTLVSVGEDGGRLYLDPSSVRRAPGRPESHFVDFLSFSPVEDRGEEAIAEWSAVVDCREGALWPLGAVLYDVGKEFLESVPRAPDPVLGGSFTADVCDRLSRP